MKEFQQKTVLHEQDDQKVEYQPTQLKKLGSAALDGFTMLPEAININESIRSRIEGRVIGQPAAIEAIIEAMDRREARLGSDNKPVASFAFLGPTGVGKTETAKALAAALVPEDEEPNLIHINCTEYKTDHQISRLVGAPPSYVGFGEKTVLNKDNITNNSVVLFDEIEKASPALYDLLLQIMDEGSLQTGDGTQLSFRDSVIIMTSNLGSQQITEHIKGGGIGFAFEKGEPNINRIEEAANKSFAKKFRPEFVNRLTKQVVFHPLDKESLSSILDVKLGDCNEEYESYDDCFRVSLSDGVRGQIIEQGFRERHLGARPLVRGFETSIMSLVGRYHGSGMIEHGSHLKVFHRDEVGCEGQNADLPDFVFSTQHDPVLIEENYYKRQAREAKEFTKALAVMEEDNPSEPRVR